MKIKDRIIKWLGGYTQDELVEQKKIEFCRTEKQLFPIVAEFAVDAQYNDLEPSASEFVKHNLGYQIADFMLQHMLLDYTITHDETTNCYIIRAKAYVREP